MQSGEVTLAALGLEAFCDGGGASAYEVGPALTKGAYGSVHRAVRVSDGEKLCVKRVDMAKATSAERTEAANEVRLLAAMRGCRYVVRFVDCYCERTSLCIVMEYAGGGNLSDYLASRGGRPLPEARVWRIFAQCLVALAHCHARRVCHRDVKSMNVFLALPSASGDDQAEVRLGDLGVGKRLKARTAMASTFVGTPYYLAPEMIKRQAYGYKADVWSLGVLLYEIGALAHPFDAASQDALFRRITTQPPSWSRLEQRYSRELCEVCKACLQKDPTCRPDAFALLESPLLRRKCDELGVVVPAVEALQTMSMTLSRPPLEAAQAGAAVAAAGGVGDDDANELDVDTAEAKAAEAEAAALRAEAEAAWLEAEASRLESLALTRRANSLRDARDARARAGAGNKAHTSGARKVLEESNRVAPSDSLASACDPREPALEAAWKHEWEGGAADDDASLRSMSDHEEDSDAGAHMGETERRALAGGARVEVYKRTSAPAQASSRGMVGAMGGDSYAGDTHLGDGARGSKKLSVAEEAARTLAGKTAGGDRVPVGSAYRTSSQIVGSFVGKEIGSLYGSGASFGRKRSDLIFVPDIRSASRPSSAAQGGRAAAGVRFAPGAPGGGNPLAPRGAARPSSARPAMGGGSSAMSSSRMSSQMYSGSRPF